MKVIKTIIIGASGKMGQIRRNHVMTHGGYDIVAVCDINIDSLQDYDCPKYSDWKQCLQEIYCDAVIVCTYNDIICDIVCYALELGVNVFSEKPPGRSLSETLMMKEAEHKSGRVLKFAFNHRYHNSIIEAKALADSGLLGKLVCARGVYGKAGSENYQNEWRNNIGVSGGGILIDQGIHMLDLLSYFMGDLFVVAETVDNLVWNDVPVEDSVFAIMKNGTGQIASLHSSVLQWKHKFDLDLMFENGYIALNGLLTSTKSYGQEKFSYYRKDLYANSGKLGNPVEHTMWFDNDNSWELEMAEFYNSVAKNAPLCNGTSDDAVRVMGLIEAIYLSKE